MYQIIQKLSKTQIDYLVQSYLIKLTMVGGGVAAVYFLSIESKRFVALMNKIVASMMILLMIRTGADFVTIELLFCLHKA